METEGQRGSVKVANGGWKVESKVGGVKAANERQRGREGGVKAASGRRRVKSREGGVKAARRERSKGEG